MKVNKKQLEAMIRESVEEEISNLNEEELDELLGGLKGLAGGAGAGLKRAGQAVAGGARRAGGAIAGAARGAAGAVAGAASGAAGAVKGAYQAGEKKSALAAINKALTNALGVVDQAVQKMGNDPDAQELVDFEAQLTNLQHTFDAQLLRENKTPAKKTLRRKTK